MPTTANRVESARKTAALAEELMARSRFEDACALIDRAATQGITAATLRLQSAVCRQRMGQFDKALRMLTSLLNDEPNMTQAIHCLVDCLVMLGRHDDAAKVLLPIIDDAHIDAYLASAFAQIAQHIDRESEAFDYLQQFAGDPGVIPPLRRRLGLQRARLLDRAGDYDEAFASATRAHAACPVQWSESLHARETTAVIESFTRAKIEALPRARGNTARPIFIAGVPRSGTSLMESILSAHPKVHAGGELPLVPRLLETLPAREAMTQRRVSSLSSKLLDAYRRINPKAPHITDKQLACARHFGMLQLLAPQSHIIWCRRDARDSALSCYFHDFQSGFNCCANLDQLRAFQADYQRLMEHWQQVLDIPITEVVYEDLARDPEPHIRRVLEAVGLEFDPACLAPHKTDHITMTVSNEQVRSPINPRSIGRWKNYQAWLQPAPLAA